MVVKILFEAGILVFDFFLWGGGGRYRALGGMQPMQIRV